MIGAGLVRIKMLQRVPVYRLLKKGFTNRAVASPSTSLVVGSVGVVSLLFCSGVGYAIYVKRRPKSVWLQCELIFDEIEELLKLTNQRRELLSVAHRELDRMKGEVQSQLMWSKRICLENEDILGELIL